MFTVLYCKPKYHSFYYLKTKDLSKITDIFMKELLASLQDIFSLNIFLLTSLPHWAHCYTSTQNANTSKVQK